MGAILDRNGLRPSRYYLTNDDRLILSSEVGVLPIDESKIIKKERLHPGKILLIDTKKKRLFTDEELKERYATKEPYGEWLDMNLLTMDKIKMPNAKVKHFEDEDFKRLLKSFGYNYEEYTEDGCGYSACGTFKGVSAFIQLL